MPETRWRRLWRETTASGRGTRGHAKPPSTRPRPAGRPQYLYRAVNCYLRAGESVEAAHCLRRLGEYEQAALLYLGSGSYEYAAVAYVEGGQPETAAWVYVHNLGRPQVARDILRRMEQSAARPTQALPGDAPASAGRLSSWHDQIGLTRDRLSGAPSSSDPADDAAPASTCQRITSLAAELIGDSGGRRELTPFLEQVRALKQAAISQDDWPAGYAARELERLLLDERDARNAERRAAEQRHEQDRIYALSLRQVQARCDAADGVCDDGIITVLTQTQELLADPHIPGAERTETWAVAIAEAIRRYDQAALVFAAAVRGHRPGAAARWREWSAQVLKVNLTVPADAELR